MRFLHMNKYHEKLPNLFYRKILTLLWILFTIAWMIYTKHVLSIKGIGILQAITLLPEGLKY